MITLFAQENFCGVCSSMVQHILNKAKIHTQVLFCCLKCPLAVTHFVFITVMQFIFNVEMNRLIKKDRIKLIKVTFYSEKPIPFT